MASPQRQPLRLCWIAIICMVACRHALALPPDHTQWSAPVFRGAYKLIASAEEWTVLDTAVQSTLGPYLRTFWKRRDPTPTTEPNEFKDQFEMRVELAAARYRAIPAPAPWDARGDILIKLGSPGGMAPYFFSHRRRPPAHPGHPELGQVMMDDFPDSGEVWYYPGYLDGQDLNVYFAKDGFDMEMFPTRNTNLLDTTHVAYELPFGVREIEMALDWFPFRRVDGDYDVYIACSTPLQELARRSDRQEGDLSYTGRVTAFDSTLQTVWADSMDVDLHLERLAPGMLAQHQWQTVLPAGFYMIAAELEDPLGNKHSAGSFNRWLVPYAHTVKLDLSPLVIAATIRPAPDDAPGFVRNGKAIVPLPSRVFRTNQDVYFYHEVYDLNPDSTGMHRYRVQYTLYDRKRNNARVLYEGEFASAESQTFQAGSIPHSKLQRLEYILEAEVLDLNAGTTRTALAEFMVK